MTPEQKMLALEAKVSNLVSDNTLLRRKLRAAIQEQGIYQTLADEMQALISPFTELPEQPVRVKSGKNIIQEHLVMHLSDEHADEIVIPEKVGELENYNFDVALCRAEKYIDTVINFTQKTMSNYDFPVLHILSNGDHVSGEIHGAVNHSYYRNMFKNSLAVGQMHALMIRDLAPYFKQINVLCLSGNHGRRSAKKNYEGAHDNWDYLVHQIAKLHCGNLKNVNFTIPDAWSANLDINGHGFCVSHGDDIKSWNSIPYYGIERKTRRLVSLNAAQGKQIKYFVFGHFHTCSGFSDLDGETLVNGAWLATNPYAYESFSSFREPSQLIHGVHKDQGISWRMHVKLKDFESEKKGPQRYKINFED